MAQSFDGIIIDRILSAVAESSDGKMLYRLTQLSEASIDTTSESKEAKDAQGILIKRTYQSKSVEFKATNAFLDLNVIGETTGSGKKIATSSKKIVMPTMEIIEKDKATAELTQTPKTGTVKVVGLSSTGSIAKSYKITTMAAADAAALSGTTLTLPTGVADDADVAQVLVKYEYESENGVMVDQRADQFPGTVKLTLSVLVYDPCSTDILRHAYIVFPSFQVSPDTSFTLSTETTMDFSGVAQVDYCSPDKQLYYIVLSEDDIEE